MERLLLGQSSVIPYEGNGNQTSSFAKQHVRNMKARSDGKEILKHHCIHHGKRLRC